MNLREHITMERLHHAYLIEGERVVILAQLMEFLETSGMQVRANPDLHIYEHDAFLLEHAHQLRREQSMHATVGGRKIFVVMFNTMMSEAQNALLKSLEEPTAGTHFFFITRTGEILFSTVRSRMQVIRNQREISREVEKENLGEVFLGATIAERLKMIERFVKAKTDEKSKAKEEARVFLESLERALYVHLSTGGAIAEALADVVTAKRYLSDRAPSLKLLFEHLALTVPTVSQKH
jgi:DNA polymerase III delta prime subunit